MAKDRAQNAIEQRPQSLDLAARQADAFGKAVGRSAYEYRYELALVAIPVGACAGLILELRQNPVTVVVAAAAVLVAARRTVGRALASARIRRRWDQAVRHYRAERPRGIPGRARVTHVDQTWSGHSLRMRVDRGLSFSALAAPDVSRALEASMRVARIKIKQDPENAHYGSLALISRNPLLERVPVPPGTFDGPASIWDPFPIGIDEFGDVVDVTLSGNHFLIGGMTGAGKSVALSLPVARAALDPTVRMYLFDPKRVELSIWKGSAERFVVEHGDAIEVLGELEEVMDDRLRQMEARTEEEGRLIRDVQRDSGWDPIVVVIDELAEFTDTGDAKESKAFTGALLPILRRGRAPGFSVIAATQRPDHTAVPTQARAQFPYRLALACDAPESSNTILGTSYAARGFDASTIAREERGVGYLKTEQSDPARMRCSHLTDEDVYTVARRAQQLRQSQSHRGRPLRSVV